MTEKRTMKPLRELDLLDRFLFDNVMEDPQTCEDILSICLGEDIPVISNVQKEKELEISNALRAIRLDIFSMDEDDTVYNAEMQRENTRNLPKRSRFYQAHLDVSLLEPGETEFNKLNNSYFIMIMPFDLFGKGKYRYTFEYTCNEDSQVRLGDGATKIFLNTRGKNTEEVSQELIDFLSYVEDSSHLPENALSNEKLKRIHGKVNQIKENEEMGVRYMQEWEEKVRIKEEGRNLGEYTKLIKLIIKKYQNGKTFSKIAEDLEEDPDDLKELYDCVVENCQKTPEEIYKIYQIKK